MHQWKTARLGSGMEARRQGAFLLILKETEILPRAPLIPLPLIAFVERSCCSEVLRHVITARPGSGNGIQMGNQAMQ